MLVLGGIIGMFWLNFLINYEVGGGQYFNNPNDKYRLPNSKFPPTFKTSFFKFLHFNLILLLIFSFYFYNFLMEFTNAC
ncbi:unnamed protein product [Meloidogyne enterolobii]|uniref:Uncharacterized protein n=1 Tax=Meloidogyne enterolobii TaxID=390850 RepID=A0ACB0XPH1_MELEN